MVLVGELVDLDGFGVDSVFHDKFGGVAVFFQKVYSCKVIALDVVIGVLGGKLCSLWKALIMVKGYG